MLVHTAHHSSPSGTSHDLSRNPSPVPSLHPFILTERPDVAAERLSRKRSARIALNGAKQEWIASVLGVSRQYIARCLSDGHRDELSAVHLAKLGVAGVRQ